jgi:hypothetical protein
LLAEQRDKIISAQDYLFSESGAAVAEYTRVGINNFQQAGLSRATLEISSRFSFEFPL